MDSEQDGAIPWIRTTLARAARYPRESSTEESGAGMSKMRSAPILLKTSEYVLLVASSRRKSENIVRAGDGTNLSTVCRTSELLTCPSTSGNGDPFSTDPTTQAISRKDTTLTTAPPTESSAVADRQVTVDRMAAPMEEATNCPITAKLTSRTMATTVCCV